MGRNRYVLMVMLAALIAGCAGKAPQTPAGKTAGQAQSALDTQLDALAQQIVGDLTQQRKSRLAVIEFTDLDGRTSSFGKLVAEELTTRLFATKKFQLVERQLIEKVLKEQSLGLSGTIDQTTAQRVGAVLGVEAIATGSVMEIGDSIKINARIVATDTGSVFAAAAVSVPRGAQTGNSGEEIHRTGMVYLSDIEPTFANVGWGKFERDVFRERYKIRLNYQDYAKGLHTHAPARVSYALNGTYHTFESLVGLWDSGNSERGVPGDMSRKNGSVIFRVFLDGKEAYNSGLLTWDMTKKVSISVKGVKSMDLVVDEATNGNFYDWSVWGDAKLFY